MSERSRTQDILVDILGVQNNINTVLGQINIALSDGEGGISGGVNGINTPLRHGARVIYVDSSNGSGTYDGTTRATAWRTIQEGIDDADTKNLSDLILIFDDPGGGGYDINRADEDNFWRTNVIIVGIGREQVRIYNSYEGASRVLGFDGCSIYLSNVRFWNGDEEVTQNLLYLYRCDGSELENVDFYLLNAGVGSTCLYLNECGRTKTKNSHFYIFTEEEVGNTIGVLIDDASQNEIESCIFDGSHPSVPGGIGILTSGTCRGNVFTSNSFIENIIAIDLVQTTENNFSVRNNEKLFPLSIEI